VAQAQQHWANRSTARTGQHRTENDGLDMLSSRRPPLCAEMLQAWADRVAMVRDFLAVVTSDELTARRKNPQDPEHQKKTWRVCTWILEEWEHTHSDAVRVFETAVQLDLPPHQGRPRPAWSPAETSLGRDGYSATMGHASLDDLTDTLRRSVTAHRSESQLLAPGSAWNLSQTVQHCAQTIDYSVTGYPRLKPRLYRASVGALAKRVFLRRGAMRHPLSAQIDGAPALDPALPPAEAVGLLAEAVRRFTTHTSAHAPHPVYGLCTHEEFAALHRMHLLEHLPGVSSAESAAER
jgi:Protein of unknown function (DUF1569)